MSKPSTAALKAKLSALKQQLYTDSPAGQDAPTPPGLYDLYDHQLGFLFKGLSLPQVIDIAMQSAWDDELELYHGR